MGIRSGGGNCGNCRSGVVQNPRWHQKFPDRAGNFRDVRGTSREFRGTSRESRGTSRESRGTSRESRGTSRESRELAAGFASQVRNFLGAPRAKIGQKSRKSVRKPIFGTTPGPIFMNFIQKRSKKTFLSNFSGLGWVGRPRFRKPGQYSRQPKEPKCTQQHVGTCKSAVGKCKKQVPHTRKSASMHFLLHRKV